MVKLVRDVQGLIDAVLSKDASMDKFKDFMSTYQGRLVVKEGCETEDIDVIIFNDAAFIIHTIEPIKQDVQEQSEYSSM